MRAASAAAARSATMASLAAPPRTAMCSAQPSGPKCRAKASAASKTVLCIAGDDEARFARDGHLEA
eukprot:scaffold99909_cov69-Phaeocystis_antarctica.AAC.6